MAVCLACMFYHCCSLPCCSHTRVVLLPSLLSCHSYIVLDLPPTRLLFRSSQLELLSACQRSISLEVAGCKESRVLELMGSEAVRQRLPAKLRLLQQELWGSADQHTAQRQGSNAVCIALILELALYPVVERTNSIISNVSRLTQWAYRVT